MRSFWARVWELGVDERAVRAPSQLKSVRTRVLTSLESLLASLKELPADTELEVAHKKGIYMLYIRR